MKTVFELCKPRASVFADTTRDDVLNLSDLIAMNLQSFSLRGIKSC